MSETAPKGNSQASGGTPEEAAADVRMAQTLVDTPTEHVSGSDTPSTPADLGIHDPLHRYKLGEVIGEGGMSVVRRVTDISLHRRVVADFAAVPAFKPVVDEARQAISQHGG